MIVETWIENRLTFRSPDEKRRARGRFRKGFGDIWMVRGYRDSDVIGKARRKMCPESVMRRRLTRSRKKNEIGLMHRLVPPERIIPILVSLLLNSASAGGKVIIALTFASVSADANGRRYNVQTLNDQVLCDVAPIEPKTPPNPLKNDKPFLTEFPYLAKPW
jgi:hypothetical protein